MQQTITTKRALTKLSTIAAAMLLTLGAAGTANAADEFKIGIVSFLWTSSR